MNSDDKLKFDIERLESRIKENNFILKWEVPVSGVGQIAILILLWIAWWTPVPYLWLIFWSVLTAFIIALINCPIISEASKGQSNMKKLRDLKIKRDVFES